MRSAPNSWSTVIPWRARAMRHAKRGRKLGREAQHRNLMLGTMAGQLITHGRIKTTAPKAKELRGVVDKLINTAKEDDLTSRRRAVKVLKDKTVVRRLFEDVAPELDDRNSGYTRTLKLGPDSATAPRPSTWSWSTTLRSSPNLAEPRRRDPPRWVLRRLLRESILLLPRLRSASALRGEPRPSPGRVRRCGRPERRRQIHPGPPLERPPQARVGPRAGHRPRPCHGTFRGAQAPRCPFPEPRERPRRPFRRG